METSPPQIHVLTGGPYHPVTAQFQLFQKQLGTRAQISFFEGAEAFDHLNGCDLLVCGGLHWTGSDPEKHQWPEGVQRCGYVRPTERQKQAYVEYVASGRPLLGWHGGIASYDDWLEFGTLLGFRWDWQVTSHSDYGEYAVTVEPTGHPVLEGVSDYRLQDELYYNVQVTPGLEYAVHAFAALPNNVRFPMIMTGEGGRMAGAGRTAYLANGHDLQSTACEPFQKAVINTLEWLLGK